MIWALLPMPDGAASGGHRTAAAATAALARWMDNYYDSYFGARRTIFFMHFSSFLRLRRNRGVA